MSIADKTCKKSERKKRPFHRKWTTFTLQRDYSWSATVVLLPCKSSPIGM